MMLNDNNILGLKKGVWSPEEDEKLIAYINKHGLPNWSKMPKLAALSRSGKSCRLRWFNYLRPDLKRGRLTLDEIKTIKTLHESLGNKWSKMAEQLPGRTDNEIKNFWNTHVKKCLKTARGTSACKAKRSKFKGTKVAKGDASVKYVNEELHLERSNCIESTQFPIAESYSPSNHLFVTNGSVDENKENMSTSSESHGDIPGINISEDCRMEGICIPEINPNVINELGWVYPGHESMSTYPSSYQDELTDFWFHIWVDSLSK